VRGLCAGTEVPDWARSELPKLPSVMEGSNRRGSSVDRECVDLVETVLLKDHVGEQFTAVVIDLNERIDWDHNGSRTSASSSSPNRPSAPLRRPRPALGQEIEVRLTESDVATRRILFEAVAPEYSVRTVRRRPSTPASSLRRRLRQAAETRECGESADKPGFVRTQSARWRPSI